jgi:hypothetical protein
VSTTASAWDQPLAYQATYQGAAKGSKWRTYLLRVALVFEAFDRLRFGINCARVRERTKLNHY